jgi:hypothetical protein
MDRRALDSAQLGAPKENQGKKKARDSPALLGK